MYDLFLQICVLDFASSRSVTIAGAGDWWNLRYGSDLRSGSSNLRSGLQIYDLILQIYDLILQIYDLICWFCKFTIWFADLRSQMHSPIYDLNRSNNFKFTFCDDLVRSVRKPKQIYDFNPDKFTIWFTIWVCKLTFWLLQIYDLIWQMCVLDFANVRSDFAKLRSEELKCEKIYVSE